MKKLTFVLVLSALAVSACSESSDKDNPECNPETGTCDPSGETQCTNDTWKCDGNILSKCVSGKWEISQTCAANTMCNAGTGTCDPSGGLQCTNDTWKCDGSTLSKCVSGKWEISQTCAANTLCNAGTGTCDPSGGLQCTNDTWKCDGNILSKCVSGKWEISQTCAANTMCNAGRGTCDPNKIECSGTEHLFAEQCEADDVTHCGTHTNDCTQNNGWKTGQCIGKNCLAETCTTGYHLESLFDENNTERTICAEDKHDACGSINKKCKADEVCTEGQCQSKCKPGEVLCSGSCIDPMTSRNFCGADVACSSYIPCSEFEGCIGGKCVLTSCQNAEDSLCTGTEQNVCVNIHGSNLSNCGACGVVCSDKETAKASGCSQGNCTYTCQAGMVNCGSDTEPMCLSQDQLKSDPLHCGKCGTKCADNAFCQDGQCIVSSCTGNECLYNNACINQNTHCGTQCLNCNTANHASAGVCQNGTCIISSCVAGFHLTDKGTCETDSAAACPNGNATGTVNCNTLGYTKAGICEKGICKATECQANAHIKDNKCVADTLESCGSEDNNCTKIAGWKTGKCENGKCVATTCQSGFCLNPLQGQCTNVQSSTTCGMDGGACVSCTIKQICSAGACAAKKCEGNVCQQPTGADKEDLCQNDNTHCGSSCQNCNTFTANATAGTCRTDGTCQVTACKTGHHIYNNACEADSSTNCGEHDKRCNVANATNTCSGGKCTFICDSDYHAYDNACEADSTEHCGVHGKKCNSGYTCNTNTDTCEKPKCTNAQCKAMTGDEYIGNVCVDGYDGDQTCGCNSNSDCKSGYRCNATMMMCVDDSGTCTTSACSAMTGDSYYGNACVDNGTGGKMCGCTKNSDCKSGYTCNTAMQWCVKDGSSCNATECKAATGIYYFGNVCIDDGLGGKMCGCINSSDCNTGYICADDTCVKNTCSSSYDCADGYICDNGTCKKPGACANDSDCAAGYVCDNGTCKKSGACANDSDCAAGYVCDNGTCVKSTETNSVKIVFTNGGTCEKIMAKSTGITKCECTDTSDACSTNKYKKLAITFDNGIVMDITSSAQLASAKYVSLKKGGPQIEINNMKKLSTIDFTMQFGSDLGPTKVKGNPLLITDSNGNKQQFFGVEDKSSTPVTHQYNLSGTAQKVTMTHDPDTSYDNAIYINDIQITAP